MQFLCGCTGPMASMVMMWPKLVPLRSSIMAASVVLFCREPVAPTTITSSRLACTTSRRMGGRVERLMVGSVDGMVRSTRPTWPAAGRR